MLYAALLFAQESVKDAAGAGGAPASGTGTGAAPGGGDWFTMLLPILIVVFIGYFLLFRPAQRQEAERKKLLSSLKKGDDVITNAGIYGQVVSVSETEDEVTIKVDEGTRLKMLKSVIVRNLTNEKAFKEEQEKAKEKK